MILFCFLYTAAFALIAARMLYYRGSLKRERLDNVIMFYTIFLFTFTFTYFEDTIMIYENARVFKSALKHGQLLNYYDFAIENSAYSLNANYNIILYFIFAVCMLPYDICCKLFGDIPLFYGHMWYNVLVSVLFVFTSIRFRSLLTVWKIDEKTKEMMTVLYYMNPVLLFCTVGFSQLDIFYIAIFLEGLILFEKGKTDRACLLWSLSVAMKGFPILIIVPLILLRDKRLLYILRYTAEALSLSAIFHLIYGSSTGWIRNQEHSPHYEKLFSDRIPSQVGTVSVFLVLYLLILFFCWISKKESFRSTILCGLSVYMCFFCFTAWLPQYAAMCGLFLILSVLLVGKPHYFLGIETFFSLGYIFSVWLKYPDVNNSMLVGAKNAPVFKEFVMGITTFKYPLELALSISTAAGIFLLVYTAICVKKEENADWNFPAGYLYLPMMPVYAILMLSAVINHIS
ncbi:MAG: hypothetical protein K5686_02910 [Lachnospiraceae bacterium]|nr:hypothetical protein [Lachnospiraceae bacterium]